MKTRKTFDEITRDATAGRDPRTLLTPTTQAGRELLELGATVWGARVALEEALFNAENLGRSADAIDRRAAADAVESARLAVAAAVRKVRPAAARAVSAIGQQRRALVHGGERDGVSEELRQLRREGARRDLVGADPEDRVAMLDDDTYAEAVVTASDAWVRRLAIPVSVEDLRTTLAQRRSPAAYEATEEGAAAARLLQNELRAAEVAGGADWVERAAAGEAAN